MDKEKKQNFTGAELLEVKKSRKADLEQNRTTWLLFGFVFFYNRRPAKVGGKEIANRA